MTVTISQKELIKMVQEKIIGDIEVDEVIIQLELTKHSTDNIFIKENSWFVGSFIRKRIKGEE